MDSTPVQLKSPNKGDSISFDILSYKERQRVLKEEVQAFYKMHKNIFYEMPIHLLKNGDYLYEVTGDGYAFRFHTLQSLDLLLDRTRGYYNVSTHCGDGTCKYAYYLQNDKIIELLNYPNKVQIEGYDRTPNWKVLELEDGAILYFEKRAENVFSAVWYPNLQTFEYYYYNNYAP